MTSPGDRAPAANPAREPLVSNGRRTPAWKIAAVIGAVVLGGGYVGYLTFKADIDQLFFSSSKSLRGGKTQKVRYDEPTTDAPEGEGSSGSAAGSGSEDAASPGSGAAPPPAK